MRKKNKGRRRQKRSWFPWLATIGFLMVLVKFPLILQVVYPLPYQSEITAQCEKYQTDQALVLSVIYNESRFRPKAVSSAGAKGLMQIMPVTGAWIAQHMELSGYHEDLLFDPDTNIAMGIWYLTWLEGQFGQDTTQVIAAYNAGPNNVKKWLENGVWDGTKQDLDRIPYKETREYIKRVLNQYANYSKIYSGYLQA
jgi:soluble lytic murein transglycosylase